MERGLHATKRIWALALIVGHLLAVAMAWSPSLHHWAHGDADEAHHHSCAIAAVLTGQIDQPGTTALSAAPPLLAEESLLPFETGRRPQAAIRDSGRERAPPVV